ncbi:hypothetical protein SKB0092_35780 [Roseomonas mucosa]
MRFNGRNRPAGECSQGAEGSGRTHVGPDSPPRDEKGVTGGSLRPRAAGQAVIAAGAVRSRFTSSLFSAWI